MTKVQSTFSLADITDFDAFRTLGRQLAANPEDELRRTKVSARVVTGPDGFRRTELVTSSAVDRVDSPASMLPVEASLSALADVVLGLPMVPVRKEERKAVAPMLDAFVDGLGSQAAEMLSSYFDRAAARLAKLVADEHRKYAAKPSFEQVIDVVTVGKVRTSSRRVTKDRVGKFSKSLAYNGWQKSLYGVDWFDSEPERAVASIVDDASEVKCWTRLHINELPILWTGDGREYNADFIVIDNEGTHWVVEVKSDRDVKSGEVTAKQEAARRWSQHVNANADVDSKWSYLLVSETDIKQAQGSWRALKKLGS